MPVIFGSTTIGGDSASPAPKVNIEKTINRTGAGTPVGYIYNITVAGYVISEGTVTTPGSRQSNLQSKILAKLKLGAVDQLQVTPYGGLANKLKFPGAEITSISIPEPEDSSMWVQDAQYTINFQAYYEITEKGDFDYNISSYEDSWDVAEQEGVSTVHNIGSVSGADVYRTYTVTHTMSAQGANRYTDTKDTLATNGEAWVQAELFVKSIAGSANAESGTPLVFGNEVTAWDVKIPGSSAASATSVADLGIPAGYEKYNHVRQATVDRAGGTYSISDTWIYAKPEVAGASKYAATHEMEVSLDEDVTTGDVNITVAGTLTGLSTEEPKTDTDKKDTTKYSGALSTFNYLKTNNVFFNSANALYKTTDAYNAGASDGGTLKEAPLTSSVGRNEIAGVITYSFDYNDRILPITPNALSETISQTDENEDGNAPVIAEIAVIGRTLGPVIQNMGTTTSKKRSLSVELVMKKTHRDEKPTFDYEAYVPTATVGPILEPITETWDASAGTYSLSVSWIYE